MAKIGDTPAIPITLWDLHKKPFVSGNELVVEKHVSLSNLPLWMLTQISVTPLGSSWISCTHDDLQKHLSQLLQDDSALLVSSKEDLLLVHSTRENRVALTCLGNPLEYTKLYDRISRESDQLADAGASNSGLSGTPTPEPVSIKKQQLQRVVAAAMRLRGLSTADADGKNVHRQVLAAAEFSLRRDLEQSDLVAMQERVDKILTLLA